MLLTRPEEIHKGKGRRSQDPSLEDDHPVDVHSAAANQIQDALGCSRRASLHWQSLGAYDWLRIQHA